MPDLSAVTIKISIVAGKKIRLPEYMTPGAAGMDLFCPENVFIKGFTKMVIPMGFKVKIPPGYELQIRPRGGMSLKTPIHIANSPGTIDSDYRGEVGVIVHNISPSVWQLKKDQPIAQAVLKRVETARLEIVDHIRIDTERGDGAYGSTG